jgi:hypothetical protein
LVAGLTPGKSLGIQQRIAICIKTHAKASPEYNRVNIIYYKPLFMTWSKGSEFENSGNK